MKYYSQNNEDEILLNWFGDFKGNLLSIGENSGTILSNAKAFIDAGWSATLVEPSKRCFKELCELHKDNSSVECFNFAISDRCGKAKFYESNEHISKDDWGLLSTLDTDELKRWPNQLFTETEVEMYDFETFVDEHASYHTYEYITCDAEAYDLKIAKQINFNDLGTQAFIVEWNGRHMDEFIAIMQPYGFRILHTNAENIIFVR